MGKLTFNVCMACGAVLRAEDSHFHTRPVEQVCCKCAGCNGEVALGSARTEVWYNNAAGLGA